MAKFLEVSNRWKINRERLQELHRKLSDKQGNWQHQITKKLSALYNTVILEELNTQAITANKKGKKLRKMNKNILDTGWYRIEQLLSYKCGDTIKVPSQYTSQACSSCGCISRENRKSQSKFKCIDCGYEFNADLNDCLNILERGLEKIKTLGNRVTGQEDYRRSKIWSVNCQRELL